MDGTTYGPEEVMGIYLEAVSEFKRSNPTFIGSKFIYTGSKHASSATIASYFEIVQRLHAKYPDDLAGFDMVVQEDTAISLVQLANRILALPKDLRFYFHAGETNWFGSIDENLVSR